MPALHLSYAMVHVSDMDRAVAFYRDQLGLTLRFASPDWTEFETGSTTLALHGGAEGQRPPGTPAGSVGLGFAVDDLDAACTRLQAAGVRFVMPPTDRAGEGIRLAIAIDPDGTSLSFSQRV
ncbi:MAG: VOC family protein [Alphaproteobacteria bacterium]|nr:VOC family protein [Alphaproteobacteria bacterium]